MENEQRECIELSKIISQYKSKDMKRVNHSNQYKNKINVKNSKDKRL